MRSLAPRQGGLARCGSSLPHLSLSLSLSCLWQLAAEAPPRPVSAGRPVSPVGGGGRAARLTAEAPVSLTVAGRVPATVFRCPRAGGYPPAPHGESRPLSLTTVEEVCADVL
jgi:hypothetical protein